MTIKIIELVFIIVILLSPNVVILYTKSEPLDVDEISIFDEVNESNGYTFPGTKWCGPGNTAHNESDLGSFTKEDVCCREHDMCDHIEAGETKHNLTNPDAFTRLHCKCDKDFLHCLKSANSIIGFAIGRTYTTIRKYCYKFEYPIKWCVKYQQGYLHNRCIRYRLDTTKPKRWQWFDIPFY